MNEYEYKVVVVDDTQKIKERYDSLQNKHEIDREWFAYHPRTQEEQDRVRKAFVAYFKNLSYMMFDVFFEHNFLLDFYVIIKINPYQKQVKMYAPFLLTGSNTLMFTENYQLACPRGFKIVEQDLLKLVFPTYESFFE